MKQKRIYVIVVGVLLVCSVGFLAFFYHCNKRYDMKAYEIKQDLFKIYAFTDIICNEHGSAWYGYIFDKIDYIDLKNGKRSRYRYDMSDPKYCSDFSQMILTLMSIEKQAGCYEYLDSLCLSVKIAMDENSPMLFHKKAHEDITRIYMECLDFKKIAEAPSGNIEDYKTSIDQAKQKIMNFFNESNISSINIKSEEDSLRNEVICTYSNLLNPIDYEKLKQDAEYRHINELFLEKNKGKEGVHVTESGLQYKVLSPGTGYPPNESDIVSILYEGKLIDGTVVDATSMRNDEPFVIDMKNHHLIQGFIEAIKLMPEKSEWEVYLPSSLAYQERHSGEIKPYSTLVFKIKILKIKRVGK